MTYRASASETHGATRDRGHDRAVALSIAPRYLLTRKMLDSSLVEGGEVTDTYTRARFTIERRTPVEHRLPSAPNRKPGFRVYLASHFDPWEHTPDHVPDITRSVSPCDRCDGACTVRCWRCSGSARVSCTDCWGRGHKRVNDKKRQCGACDGAGTRRCGRCNNGRTPCDRCDALGALERWLSIEVEIVQQVRVHDAGAAAGVHHGLLEPTNFDATAWQNELLDDRRFDGHPLGLEPALTPALDSRLDRVQATRVQDFRGVANVFHYELAFARGTIDVAGNQATISSTSKLGALAFRRVMIVLTALAGLVGTYALWASYELQHPWFHSRGCGGLLVAGGVTAAMGVTWLVGATMLASAARKAARPLGGAALGIVAVALTVVAWHAKAPSTEQARAYLAANRPEAAEYEAMAVRQLGKDPLGASGVLDELHDRRFEAAASLEEKAKVLDQTWNLAEPRQRATDRFLALADARATDVAFSAPGLRTLAGVVKPIDPLRTTQWEGRAELLEARDAIARRDWEHAIDHLEAAATRLGPEPCAKHMRRLESTLENETRSHIVKARATPDPIEKDAAWTAVRRSFASTARIRGLTHSSPPADWLALEAKTKTEAAAATKKAEAAAKKSEAPAKKRVDVPHAGKGR